MGLTVKQMSKFLFKAGVNMMKCEYNTTPPSFQDIHNKGLNILTKHIFENKIIDKKVHVGQSLCYGVVKLCGLYHQIDFLYRVLTCLSGYGLIL